MNAFAPRYDPATGRAVMYPHPDGAWVHVGDALEMKNEIERLREIVAVNDQRLADVWDKSKAEVEKLRSLLSSAHEAIRCGFMDGEWATIVQRQKELLPWSAVLESRHAELVINQIREVLREQKT